MNKRWNTNGTNHRSILSRYLFPPHLKEILTRRKPITPIDFTQDEGSSSDDNVGLRRSLTAWDLVLYGVGSSVGAGIYGLVGIGADIAGPGIALSFLACGIACIFTSLAYAEFAARVPLAGSAYIYAYVTFGELSGFLAGWFLTLGYGFTAAVVARAWAEYLADFIRGLCQGRSKHWLDYLTRLPIPIISEHYTCSPLSILIIVLCTLVLVSGAKESSRFNNAMTLLNVSVLSFVVFSGLETDSITVDNLQPVLPHGITGVAQGAGFVFFAFIGFDMVACLSEEVKNPKKDMPIGIVGSLLICTAIYVTVSVAVIGMAPIPLLGRDVPISNALLANACCSHQEQLMDDSVEQCLDSSCSTMRNILLYGSKIVSFGSIFGLTSGTFTSLMGQPRILYRMAQDGLLYKVFARVDPKTQVPTFGILITGITVSVLACFVELEALANLISLGTLMVFTFVDAGIIILRLDSSSSTTATNRPEETTLVGNTANIANAHDDKTSVLCTVLYTTSATLGFVSFANGWTNGFTVGCVCLVVTSATILLRQDKSSALPDNTFQCPAVPLVPLIGIGCNAYMMGSLPIASWLFVMVWLLLGTMLYFSYGVWHSTLGKRQRALLKSKPSDIIPENEQDYMEASPLWKISGPTSFGYESVGAGGDEELVPIAHRNAL